MLSQSSIITKTKFFGLNPKPVLENLSDAIDFGFCPVNQSSYRTIPLENLNSFPLAFTIDENEFFTATPNQGVLSAKSKASISIGFIPVEATAIVSTMVVTIQNEEPKIIKISAIGKYPFLSLSTSKLDFETLLVNKQITKELIIKNQSQVSAHFGIQQIYDDEFKDRAFQIDIKSGDIPSKSSFLIKITFKPTVVNLISVAHFSVECPGGNSLNFECSGVGTGYVVFLSTQSINFGETRLGAEKSHLLTIHNESETQTKYEFFNDDGNVFEMTNRKGVVPAKSNSRIIVKFRPRGTIPYYERIYCIVRHHSILYLDLMGTCYDLLIKPLPILQIHVDQFRKRVIEGRLNKIDFKYLENSMMSIKSGLGPLNKTGMSQMSQSMTKENPQVADEIAEGAGVIIENNESQIMLHKELFQEMRSEQRVLQLNEEFIDFGFCEFMTVSGSRDVIVTNRLPVKLTVFCIFKSDEKTENIEELNVFSVYPPHAHVKPFGSQLFSLTFRPNKNGYYFFEYLQFFAVKKNSQLTEKLIEDAKLANTKEQKLSSSFTQTKRTNMSFIADEQLPPISFYLRCVGHSFSGTSQPFIPMIDVFPHDIVIFPPCAINDSVYQSIELINKTDTPTYYKFSPDVNKTFRVFPSCGIVEGKSFGIIILEFNPQLAKGYNQNLTCSLNHNLGHLLHINVFGYCSEPKVFLQNDGKIYFPPSYTGVYSRQKLKIKNLARIPIEYTIEVPDKYEDEVYLEPKTSKLKPNEHMLLDCSFIPYKKKNYLIHIPLKIYNILDPEQDLVGFHLPGSGKNPIPREKTIVNYQFEIIGAGGDGALDINPQEIDFGIVKVNFNKKVYFVLENFSNYMFYVELNLKPLEDQKKLDNKLQNFIQNSFSLDFENGIISANSKVEIGIIFHPAEVCDLDLVLECVAKERGFKGGFSKTSTNNYKKLLSQKCSIRIKGKGNYPLLKIIDVRNDSVSVATLWENFSINHINKELMNDLNEDERKFLNIETLNFSEATSLMKRLQSYIWNFGHLPIKANIKPRKIVITIQNVGGTDLNWNFKLPSDSQIEVEPWADPGEPTDEEAFEKAILERKIFAIHPRSGFLQPGKICDIELIYSPGNEEEYTLDKKMDRKVSEKHFLQVVLQILNGKPLLIHFKGMTLAPMEGLLAVRKNNYTLPDVPIGSLIPVTFPIEISNVGNTQVSYKIDIADLDGKEDAKGSKYKIFDIQNPTGNVNAGEKQYLYCLFRPLEKKLYNFKVTLNVSDPYKQIDSLELKIQGSGFVKNKKDKSSIKKEELPSQRNSVSSIGSKVFFSIEDIDFGELEPSKIEHRMIILYNHSEANKLGFNFKVTGLIW